MGLTLLVWVKTPTRTNYYPPDSRNRPNQPTNRKALSWLSAYTLLPRPRTCASSAPLLVRRHELHRVSVECGPVVWYCG